MLLHRPQFDRNRSLAQHEDWPGHYPPNLGNTAPIMNRAQLGQLLCETLVEVPYNSVSPFFIYFGGKSPDRRFGAACAWQALELGERLARAGCETVYYLRDHRHVAVVAESEGSRFLLDPYLLQAEPLNLSALEIAKRTTSVPCFPIYAKRVAGSTRAFLRAALTKGGCMVMLARRAYDSHRRQLRTTHRFALDLTQRWNSLPPAADLRPLLFHGEQNTLSVRVLLRHNHRLSQLLYPIALYHNESEIGMERLIMLDNDGGAIPFADTKRFRAELRTMSRSLACSNDELVGFLLEGVKLYEQHAPRHIRYKPLHPSLSNYVRCAGNIIP